MAIAGGIPSEFVILRDNFDIQDYLTILKFRLKQVKDEPVIDDEEYY